MTASTRIRLLLKRRRQRILDMSLGVLLSFAVQGFAATCAALAYGIPDRAIRPLLLILLPALTIVSIACLHLLLSNRTLRAFIRRHHGDTDPDEEEELREAFDAPDKDE